MGIRRTIPVRVVRREDEESAGEGVRPVGRASAEAGVLEHRSRLGTLEEGAASAATTQGRAAETATTRKGEGEERQTVDEWRDRALRLQAEMENYRKRQHRLAQNEIESERQRMLLSFLRVVDDLERALDAPRGNEEMLRRGVGLTHQAALKILEREGAERIEAEGRPFDPRWHEAIATVDGRHVHAGPNTVVEVMEPGYRLDGQVLRPAKVVVAV
jgi:molecular chaperone GrpE